MTRILSKALGPLMIEKAPTYANKFFYSLGFLSAISFFLLLISGIIMSLRGPGWWLTDTTGIYLRSVHMWSTQAFVIFIILHLLIVFLTSAFKKPRQLTWILGVLMMLFVLLEAEFGFVLRGDFSSQWRSLQGADFYNGSGLGHWINTLNYQQVYGIHIAAIPFLILGLLAGHYLLVKILGIAKPYRKEIPSKIVPANHLLLFARGGILIAVVLILAVLLPSPYVKPVTIQEVAKTAPAMFASTIVKEFDGSSDTATYNDNIAPYTFSTRDVFVYTPYTQLLQTNTTHTDSQLALFQQVSPDVQTQQLSEASTFFETWDGKSPIQTNNNVIATVDALVNMGKAGLYEPALASASVPVSLGSPNTYVLRFLSDSGVLEGKAAGLSLTTDQYGMLHEEAGLAPSAWWLAPIGILNHTILAGDSNGDRDAAMIFGSFFLLMMAFPFIPIVNQIPDKLGLYRLIWRDKKRSK
jgi:ubiquinol-cytochrome c reductase cytochrome b subunit